MSNARDQIGKQAMEVMQSHQESDDRAQDVAQEKLNPSRAIDSDCCADARAKMGHAKRTVRQYIQELPIKSLFIAAGAGVLLGTFWTIRRR
jgi:ElaB/YqjD/DUF883 family membrane-anchored ribosome-binding protein